MASTHDEAAESDLTLGQLLTRSLRHADKATNAPSPNDPAIQASTVDGTSRTPASADRLTPLEQSLISTTLSDLTLCASLVSHLGVFSPNETLEDISTRDLRALLVPALEAQLCLLVRTKGGSQRLEWLHRAQTAFKRYVDSVEKYEVVGQDRRKTLAGPKAGEVDPARRRAGKIAQFKMEKEIKATLEVSLARLFLAQSRKRYKPKSVFAELMGVTPGTAQEAEKTSHPRIRRPDHPGRPDFLARLDLDLVDRKTRTSSRPASHRIIRGRRSGGLSLFRR
ncbi:MAG: IGBP1/TAP42 family protein [Microbacterium hominis]|jgi:hypothetical protein|nr:IGBP1/TAP42 family protein [Microbacterium hominis]